MNDRYDFQRYVVMKETTECWPWAGDSDETGRPIFKGDKAYRTAYRIGKKREIPDGYHIHHHCECNGCVNFRHLFALSHSDHIKAHQLLREGRKIEALRFCQYVENTTEEERAWELLKEQRRRAEEQKKREEEYRIGWENIKKEAARAEEERRLKRQQWILKAKQSVLCATVTTGIVTIIWISGWYAIDNYNRSLPETPPRLSESQKAIKRALDKAVKESTRNMDAIPEDCDPGNMSDGSPYMTLNDINHLKHGEPPAGYTWESWKAQVREWKAVTKGAKEALLMR
jgi:hypothetical protein